MPDGSAEAMSGIWGRGEERERHLYPLSPIFHWRPSLQPQETPVQERKLNRKGRLGLPSRPGEPRNSQVHSYSACPTTLSPSVTPSHPGKEVPATKFHWAPRSSL